MIAPLSPYAIRGFIWYQGEANANQAWQYRTLFPALIADWRAAWSPRAARCSSSPSPELIASGCGPMR